MSSNLDETFYVGPWMNWSKGTIYGPTITMKATQGTLLVAFIALWVRWAGSHLWTILCFTTHQIRSTPAEKDGLWHQQQILLKNSTSESSLLWLLTKLSWRWKTKTQGGFYRSWMLMILTILHMVAWGFAGIFSSKITNVEDEVLIRNHLCGFVSPVLNETTNEVNVPNPWWDDTHWDNYTAFGISGYNTAERAFDYVQTCYNNQTTAVSSICSTFTTRQINSTLTRDVACPFEREMCLQQPFAEPIRIESELIDSNLHLGINAPEKDRIQYRRLMSCAPIDGSQAPIAEVYPAGDPNIFPEGDWQIRYRFMSNSTHMFTTFTYSNYTAVLAENPYYLDYRPFFAGVEYAPLEEGSEPPALIPPLHRTDADVTLLSLRMGLRFRGEVEDPWFRASDQVYVPETNENRWYNTWWLSFMGCTEQHVFCNGDKCTDPRGIGKFNRTIVEEELGYNDDQLDTFDVIFYTLNFDSTMENIVLQLRDEVLLANNYMYGKNLLSAQLAPDQWVKEMQNIHRVSLAILQRKLVEFASPPHIEIKPGQYLQDYLSDLGLQHKNICADQKVRNSAYASFSVLGLALVFIIGGFIILLNICLDTITGWCQRLLHLGVHKKLDWEESDVLMLGRLAFEGQGVGPWKKNHSIPVTKEYGTKWRWPPANGLWRGDVKSVDMSEASTPYGYQPVPGAPMGPPLPKQEVGVYTTPLQQPMYTPPPQPQY